MEIAKVTSVSVPFIKFCVILYFVFRLEGAQCETTSYPWPPPAPVVLSTPSGNILYPAPSANPLSRGGRGNRRPRGIHVLYGGAIGGGVGGALGSTEGASRAATMAAAGGTIGALVGAITDGGDPVTMIGAVLGGYIGGLIGGLVGGTTGQATEAFSTVLTSVAFGAAGTLIIGDAYGPSAAVAGGVGGVVIGWGIGKVIVSPSATVVMSGAMGALGAGAGSYLASTDLIGRPR